MVKTERETLSQASLRIGILYNFPTKSLRGEVIDLIAEAEVEEQVQVVELTLEKLGLQNQKFPLKSGLDVLIKSLKSYRPDVVINLCEGAFGESSFEMNIPSVLELLRIPYTGSSALTLGLCQDKSLAKAILKAKGIDTPKYQVLKDFSDWKGGMAYPLFIKPIREDASIGISKESFVRNDNELKTRVNYLVNLYKQLALVEEYILGRELNVAILDNDEPSVLPISEILFEFTDEPKIVDYSAKWLRDSNAYKKTKPICPAKLSHLVRGNIEKISLEAYKALGCRDYARIDIRLKDDIPWVLEVNPNPDISPESGFSRSLKSSGISFELFIEKIIFHALKRRRKNIF